MTSSQCIFICTSYGLENMDSACDKALPGLCCFCCSGPPPMRIATASP